MLPRSRLLNSTWFLCVFSTQNTALFTALVSWWRHRYEWFVAKVPMFYCVMLFDRPMSINQLRIFDANIRQSLSQQQYSAARHRGD